MKQLNAPYNLLICQKSKIKDWAEHFKTYYEYEVIIYKKQPIEDIPANSVIIINYDLTWRRPELSNLRDFTMILDESQYIKNERCNRAEFVLGLKPSNVILLSGTPTGGKYEELWSQLKLLGWNISKKLFYKQYTITEKMDVGGFEITVVKGYKNVDRLKEKLKSHGAIFMKSEEAFNLPEQIENIIKVKNTTRYRKFKKDRVITVGGETLVGDTALTKLLYLRQLASIYNNHKHQVLKELLESTEDRIVIFYNFKRELHLIKSLAEGLEKPISYINGDGTDLNNYETKSSTVTLVQYQAGASGVNLQKANKVIYYSLPLSSELWMQSKKRIHRIGQSRACFYYYLITEKSVEDKILKVLQERRDYTLELFEKEDT
ncbi:SNF2 family DNA or RNA helicase [Acetoanaerobium pronyense]|uniref:SNF2 family DNA or RNA helicase n=1 Tax=Acetoanaerobium pronyense TaxID=1482736 RepID=A0ABS4KHX7_9FIRM|nr:DEAD/DEAH box helicase [Acetoanaerobium pronyense]MBP2026856.1 SNF2 family DNA or RNA helicase [Acetoanaerobium pronyense]